VAQDKTKPKSENTVYAADALVVDNPLYFHSEDREILRHLWAEHDPVKVYLFHEKYLLSPGQIARILRKYSAENIIEIHGDRIALTERGRRWILRNRREIFMHVSAKPWKSIPDVFRNSKSRSGKRFNLSVETLQPILKKKVTS